MRLAIADTSGSLQSSWVLGGGSGGLSWLSI